MGKKRILVVDDDRVLRRFVVEILQRKAYDVVGAESGAAAMEEIEKDPFDLVISDLKMEGMDGLELLGKVKEKTPATEVIIMTAFGTVSTAVQAIKEGAYDYLTKPIEVDELHMLVKRVFEHQQLVDENRYLKEKLARSEVSDTLVGKGEAAKRVRELVETVAPLDSTVLIQGETGTGKEVYASAIHKMSPRKNKPFIKVNCAALPDTLMESELFGYEKGAFTGAVQRTKGRFELADGGTLLLDEIGELGIQVQAKLLRAIQHQQFERVGSGKSIQVDVRIIATTNRNLKEEVKKERFRKDLFFRLNVVSLTLDSLRDRREDIPLFIHHFLEMFNAKHGKQKRIDDRAMDRLVQYDWPGNVRELENCIETAVILNPEDELGTVHFHFLEEHRDLLEEDGDFSGDLTIAEAEKRLILKTYRKMNSNKTHTAKKLGITIKTLRTKLREYGVVD